MTITTYETEHGDIYKDNAICDDEYKTYLSNGIGCDTIWYKNKRAAIRAIIANGRRTGHYFNLCDKCQCHFSINDPKWKKSKPYLCHQAKMDYAKQFETK